MKKATHYVNCECPLAPGCFYHVYNRTNNREPMFRTDENRRFFLEKFQTYLLPFLAVYAFCLLDNHFHFLVRIREEKDIGDYLSQLPLQQRSAVQKKVLAQAEGLRAWNEVVQSQFQRFFTSYAMAVNEQWQRKGNFFHRPFQRVAVQNERYLTRLIYYIHANPKKHGMPGDFRNYAWNSFQTMLSDGATKLERREVLDWFGGKEAFVLFHRQTEDWKDIQGLIIE